ncbi:DUF4411 family protein [Listeria grayi]|uniref:PIN domain protein n=1 Tax=Listeria grayi DSM 20601 TaxID=525367 RepID=D7UZI6_LISGR|nr:DUF4411 family protein [Listeria grayi]EFI82831.1 hypothetical protein HMPREF0556_11516 [Listeria grayi DSM 20601]
MTKYLLDSSIYISFYDRYYRFNYFPSFWNQLKFILNDSVAIPKVVISETFQSEWFLKWLKLNYENEIINHKSYSPEWGLILNHITNSDLYKDAALTSPKGWATETIADPWLIAIAIKENFTIVTDERKNPNIIPSKPHASAKIPDICDDFKIRCISMNEFFEEIALSI